MIFKQFLAVDDQLSYLLADPVTRQAALVDAHPILSEQYREALDSLGLTLSLLLETHAHETHVSLAPMLHRETGVALVAHEFCRMQCADRRVRDGDTIFLGEEMIEILATPGHSACSISFYWRNQVLTGHSLLCGATGSCVRPDSNPELLYRSIHEQLFTLPDDTLVFPGVSINRRRVTSIAEEKCCSREISEQVTVDEFVSVKQSTEIVRVLETGPFLSLNRQCGRPH